MDAALTVRAIAQAEQNRKAKVPARKVAGIRSLYPSLDPMGTLNSTDKVKLLEKVEQLGTRQRSACGASHGRSGQRI